MSAHGNLDCVYCAVYALPTPAVLYGGDKYNPEKPDIGAIVHYLSTKWDIRCIAVQCSSYARDMMDLDQDYTPNGKINAKFGFLDAVLVYKTERCLTGKINYGGAYRFPISFDRYSFCMCNKRLVNLGTLRCCTLQVLYGLTLGLYQRQKCMIVLHIVSILMWGDLFHTFVSHKIASGAISNYV